MNTPSLHTIHVSVSSKPFNWLSKLTERPQWRMIWALADLVALFAILVGPLPFWPRLSLACLFLFLFAWLIWRWLVVRVKWAHKLLVVGAPWLVTMTLAMTVATLLLVLPKTPTRAVLFDNARGAVFNSWANEPLHKPFIRVFGSNTHSLEWIIENGKRTASFNYRVDQSVKPCGSESSGGYVTFYDKPCDRLEFSSVCFDCRATDPGGAPDIGVRLVVDNVGEAGDRELVTYEFASLAKLKPFNSEWRMFEVLLSDFRQVRLRPPFPKGVDANTINKIVFFVDTRIASNCPSARLWFRNISFRQ